MGHYLDPSKITDKTIKDFIETGNNLEAYFDEMDSEMISLALRRNVLAASIDTDDNGYVQVNEIKLYLTYYVAMRISEDNIGRNRVEIPENDIYQIKYDHYHSKVKEYEKKITKEAILNTRQTRNSMVATSYGVRG